MDVSPHDCSHPAGGLPARTSHAAAEISTLELASDSFQETPNPPVGHFESNLPPSSPDQPFALAEVFDPRVSILVV
jgi:hypothetical protein